MNDQIIMHAKEPIHGAEGSAYVTIEGSRYLWFQLTEFEAKLEKGKTEIARLGTRIAGNRSNYARGTWSAKAYYNTDILRKVMEIYVKEHRDIYFDIQITNDDPNSDAGRRTVIYRDCNLDGIVLSKLDVNAETLIEDITGTFEDFEVAEEFNVLEGMTR